LCTHLQGLGIRVWFDEVVIEPGASQALQMDRGLAKAHCGIALQRAASSSIVRAVSTSRSP